MKAEHHEQVRNWIETACIWEAAAPKPGNVHPNAAFDDLRYEDFVAAAQVSAPHLSQANELGVGRSVLNAVKATREACGSNVNLGICLLIAPLAAVSSDRTLTDGIGSVLEGMSDDDARNVYEAIRLANPGGLGEAPEQDVAEPPTTGLVEAMRLAEDRDRIAWNYVHEFEDVVVTGPEIMSRWMERGELDRDTLIVALQLELLARTPDSLIARKCGFQAAQQASDLARDVLATGWPGTAVGETKLAELDAWLRSDGHRLNPGTTADLIAATLFVLLRDHPPIAERFLSK